MVKKTWIGWLLAVAAVTALTLVLHLRAVAQLPIDYDEDDYLLAAQHYAAALAAGDWREIVNWDYNFEHPPLTKLAYGLVLWPLPPAPPIPQQDTSAPPADTLPEPHFHWARTLAASLGTLEVLALALLNPLAGFFLGIQTWQLKYTSQVMLEPLPALTSLLCALFYLRGRPSTEQAGARRWPGWLVLSGVALGLTAAGKYTYCVVGLAILIDWLWATWPAERSPRAWARWFWPAAAWGLLALAVFVAADPRLWVDPVGRLQQSILYHMDYAQSAHVQEAGYPIWQPFVWLSGPVPWHPGVFVFMVDLYISGLAVLGFRRLWARQRVLALWLAAALVFLTIWNTKWPQYILILTAPLSVAAAHGLAEYLWEPLKRWAQSRRAGLPLTRPAEPARWRDLRRAWPWLAPGVVALTLIAGFPLVYQAAIALTDLNLNSLKDGLRGGVWREVWRGLTGQVTAVHLQLFDRSSVTSATVHFAGLNYLLPVLGGLGADTLFFNILWVVLSLGLQTALGLGAALLLNRRGVRGVGAWRTLLLLPWAIPEFVGALIWLRIFDPDYGWLRLALPASVQLPIFGQDKNYTLVALLIAATWYGFPLILLAASAGLKLISPEVYDAAVLEGASAWAIFREITGPLLWPLLAPALILRAIYAFNQFYLFYTLRPPFPLTTFALSSFQRFNAGQYAASAALNVFTVLILLGLILWLTRRTPAVEEVAYA